MKKLFEIAFASALAILALMSTIWSSETIRNIIYAAIIPSFILSFLSLISEISEICEKDSEKNYSSEKAISDKANILAKEKIKYYKAGLYTEPYIEGELPQDIRKALDEGIEYSKKSVISQNVHSFCIKCKNWCDIFMVGGYVLLIFSLIMHQYIAIWISAIDLNCLTLWSLLLLYISLELKTEICKCFFNYLYKRYRNKEKKKKTTPEMILSQ